MPLKPQRSISSFTGSYKRFKQLTVKFIVLVVKKQYAILDKIIFALVTEAEKQYGGDTGVLKLAAVIDWVYPKILSVIRLFLTARLLEKIINRVLTKAKERWKKNPTLAAYVGLSETK